MESSILTIIRAIQLNSKDNVATLLTKAESGGIIEVMINGVPY